MATQHINLNLTYPSRNVPEESQKLFAETKNAVNIYSMLELIRSVQRSVTNRTGTGIFFLARNPETLPLKFHPISYIKAMTDRRPNLELTTHLRLVSGSRMRGNLLPRLPSTFMASCMGNFTITRPAIPKPDAFLVL
jgi:hypothetical protein